MEKTMYATPKKNFVTVQFIFGPTHKSDKTSLAIITPT